MSAENEAGDEVTVSRTVTLTGLIEPAENGMFGLTIILVRGGTRTSDFIVHNAIYPNLAEAQRIRNNIFS